MLEIQENDYKIIVFSGVNPLNPQDDNVDIEVVFPSGERYMATFFTLDNLRTLMNRHAASGDCNYGKYLWAADMVLVRELTPEFIRETVAYMIVNRDLKEAFSLAEDL